MARLPSARRVEGGATACPPTEDEGTGDGSMSAILGPCGAVFGMAGARVAAVLGLLSGALAIMGFCSGAGRWAMGSLFGGAAGGGAATGAGFGGAATGLACSARGAGGRSSGAGGAAGEAGA